MKSTETNEFERDMAAAAFAEAGEADTAREILADTGSAPARQPQQGKSKPYFTTLVFGAISISAYVLLFQNEKLITETFTMGGWYAVFPVGTAFLFSFVHGAFASNLLTVLGLEAKK